MTVFSKQTKTTTSRTGDPIGTLDSATKVHKPTVYCAHGNFYVTQFFPPSPAYQNFTHYANSYPYFPYKDKIQAGGGVLSTSRSDIPNLGYTQMIVEGDVQPTEGNVTTVPNQLIYLGLYNAHGRDHHTPL